MAKVKVKSLWPLVQLAFLNLTLLLEYLNIISTECCQIAVTISQRHFGHQIYGKSFCYVLLHLVLSVSQKSQQQKSHATTSSVFQKCQWRKIQTLVSSIVIELCCCRCCYCFFLCFKIGFIVYFMGFKKLPKMEHTNSSSNTQHHHDRHKMTTFEFEKFQPNFVSDSKCIHKHIYAQFVSYFCRHIYSKRKIRDPVIYQLYHHQKAKINENTHFILLNH